MVGRAAHTQDTLGHHLLQRTRRNEQRSSHSLRMVCLTWPPQAVKLACHAQVMFVKVLAASWAEGRKLGGLVMRACYDCSPCLVYPLRVTD